jgi:hypothetical protein
MLARMSCPFGAPRTVVLAIAFLTGCADAPPGAVERVFDPCATRVVVPNDATDEERASVDAALALWNEAAGLSLSRDGEGEPLPIELVHTLPALFGAYDDRAGTILINRSISDPRARSIVLAHELGHAFGMLHAAPEGGESLMRAGNTSVPPTPLDVQRLRSLWDVCH